MTREMTQSVFNYSHPRYATRTLSTLREIWPQNVFDLVPAGTSYVIRCRTPLRTASVLLTDAMRCGISNCE
jgi:hypothetical protein